MCNNLKDFTLTRVKIVKILCQDSNNMKPIIIQKGWAKVRIYECPLRRGDEEYMTYIISWYIGKKRMRRGMASLELAKREAKAIAEQLADGSATALHFDALNQWAVGLEHTLHTFTMRNFTHCKSRVKSAVFLGDHYAFKSLNTLTSTFFHANVHNNGVARAEGWNIVAHLRLFYMVN